MPTTTPVSLTGKSFQFTYAGKAATGQITKASIEKSGSDSVKETWGGTAKSGGTRTCTVKADILYDGSTQNSVFAALDAAFEAGSDGELKIAEGTAASWTGQAAVTNLSAELPADDACTASVTFTIVGKFPFAPASTLAAK